MASTHSGRLERWLGSQTVELISSAMVGWYGPPLDVLGAGGRIVVSGDGDFSGRIRGGLYASLADMTHEWLRGVRRRWTRSTTLGMGFNSLADLVAAGTTGGRMRWVQWDKLHGAGLAAQDGATSWGLGNSPAAGAAAGSPPGGTVCDRDTQGAMVWADTDGDYWLGSIDLITNQGALRSSIIYDRLFMVLRSAGTGADSVTGVPTRYTGTDSAGNIAFPEWTAAVGSGSDYNWDTCTYTDQDGNAATFPAIAGRSTGGVNMICLPSMHWYMPLAAGDYGVRAVTQVQTDATPGGDHNFVIGHPLAWCPMAQDFGTLGYTDGLNSLLTLNKVYGDACINTIQFPKTATDSNMRVDGSMKFIRDQ